MSEHVHFECDRSHEGKRMIVRTIVRRKYADAEESIYEQLGYTVTHRYCGDPVCLAPDPLP